MNGTSIAGGGQARADDLTLPYPWSIHTTDPSEAWLRTQEYLGCTHRMTVLGRKPFLARVQYRALAGLGLMFSTYGAGVEISCTPPIPVVCVNFVRGGRMLIDDAGHCMVADADHPAVFCFPNPVSMRWTPGMRQLMLRIEKTRIERYLRNLLSEPLHEPLRFRMDLDLDGAGSGIASAVQTLRQALERCGKAGPSPVLAAELEHGILAALLLGQEHNYSDAIFAAQPLPAPRVVRQVMELIESSPATPFTVADLALFAGVSERSLHAAFRRQLGTTPMSYLRRSRLEQAHEELVRLHPGGGIRVTDVALRYGFPHAGRFAAAYRKRFGEPPSATLRR